MGLLKRIYNQNIDANLTVISRLLFSFLKAVLITKALVFLVAFNEHFFEKKFKLIVTGLVQEIIFVSLIVWVLFILSTVLKNKFFRQFVFVLLGIVLTFELLSSFYYVITLEPISATLLNFSFSEMRNIAQDYWTFKWHYLLFPLPFIAFLLIHKKQKEISSKWALLFFIPVFLLFTPLSSLEKLADYESSMVANKTIYFLKSIHQHEEKKDIDESIALYNKNYLLDSVIYKHNVP